MITRTQLRGHCQCCGRVHAVTNGNVAKHGYTVMDGWFQGVCNGYMYMPMEVSREQTNLLIAQVGKDVEALREEAQEYLTGKKVLKTIIKNSVLNGKRVKVEVEFDKLLPWQKIDQINRVVYELEQRAKQGEYFIKGLTDIVNGVYGKDLIKVNIEAAPSRIQAGDKRKHKDGHIYTAKSQEGARVYYELAKNGNIYKSWMGVQAWRKLEEV